jgi:hypothetical protein
MHSTTEPLHQSEGANCLVDTNPDETWEALIDFDSESVITSRTFIETHAPRIVSQTASGWGYLALVVAFILGMCTAMIAVLGWR